MNLERLMEAAFRLAKAGSQTFTNISVTINDSVSYDAGTYRRVRKAKISVMKNSAWHEVGVPDIDMNEMVLNIDYALAAPWWVVKPFMEAMEGK